MEIRVVSSFSRWVKGKALFPSQSISAYKKNRLSSFCPPSAQPRSLGCHYHPERMALPRKDRNFSNSLGFVHSHAIYGHKFGGNCLLFISAHFLSPLPRRFGPIFSIRCCWKPLTYKILNGLLQCTIV